MARLGARMSGRAKLHRIIHGTLCVDSCEFSAALRIEKRSYAKTFTAVGFGTTEFGDSKVLILSAATPVNVSAFVDFAVMPAKFTSIVEGFSAARLVISSNSFPSALFGYAAMGVGARVESDGDECGILKRNVHLICSG
jgi:hypothetical protein